MFKTKRKHIALPPNTFFMHPGARFFVTRNPFSLLHEYRTDWGFAVIIILVLVLGGLLAPILHREARLLLEPTTVTRAEITEREARTCRSKNSSYTCYYTTYRYYVGDVWYQFTHRDNNSAAVVGSTYPITYLNSEATVHHVGGRGIVLDDVWILVLMLLLLGFGGFWPPLHILVSYRSYLREGDWAIGAISDISGKWVKSGKSKRFVLSVRYGYTDPFTLHPEQGGQTATRNDLRREILLSFKEAPVLLLVKPNGASKML